jgi:hypothetical protein
MEYRDIKKDFFRDKLFAHPGDYSMVPERLVKRWEELWVNPIPLTCIPANPRLMNHYALGADPEFSLISKGTHYKATDFGLSAGRAFGADNNGRLVELRPMPSKFVLDVVASLLAEFQWAARLTSGLASLDWISVPYDQQDGLGGHVHFARKRCEEDRDTDVMGLNNIFALLVRAGVFNQKLCELRLNRSHYGKYGDVRVQTHGYEYRTFPTWLNSPWLAFLALVLAKISIYDPTFMKGLAAHGCDNEVAAKSTIFNLLRYYQTLDDDVRIAFNAYKVHGFPQQTSLDFKSEWGICADKIVSEPMIWYPAMMEPDALHRQAVFDCLISKKPIDFFKVEPNWEGHHIPEGYFSLFETSSTLRQVGIGEIISNLVCPKGQPVCLQTRGPDNLLQIWVPLEYPIEPRQIEKTASYFFPRGKVDIDVRKKGVPEVRIESGKHFREGANVDKMRAFLLSGMFPCWETTVVNKASFDTWKEGFGLYKVKLKGIEIV